MNHFVFVVLILVGLQSVYCANHIKDHTIYKISSKSDHGVLTTSNGHSESTDELNVTLKEWHDEAGQKWKSKMPLLFKTFQFKPTSIEKAELDADTLSHVYIRTKPGKNTRLWYVTDMGEGFYQIKNYETKTCLTSQGLNKLTKLMSCDNSPAQQWNFKQI